MNAGEPAIDPKQSASPADVADRDRELEALRRHGFGVAYRMLGSVSEAEDLAQEALLRLTRQEGPIAEPAAWMTTVVTRLSINVLKSARVRRESYVGPWLPEPLVEDVTPGPASRAELADSLSLALLVLFEQLTPVERAAYLLREVFGYEYAEIADVIERTEVNSRQLVTRARKHLEANRPRFDADEAARDALLERFLAAAQEGDLQALEELLARDAVLYADSGGKAMAPQEPLFGAVLIARFMAAVAQGRPASGEFESQRVRVNGQPGRVLRGPAEPPFGEAERLAVEEGLALMRSDDLDPQQFADLVKDARAAAGGATSPGAPERPEDARVWSVLTVDVVNGRIQTVRIVRNPDKLGHLRPISDLSQGGVVSCQTCE
jgi:RNA polymerase sigma-70 factor (ECF subfamily)